MNDELDEKLENVNASDNVSDNFSGIAVPEYSPEDTDPQMNMEAPAGSESTGENDPAEKPENGDGENEPAKPFSDAIDWIASMIYAVAIILVLNLFFFRMITVSGDSMNDTLVNEDRVVITNFFYKPSYGDVVVIQADKLQRKDSVLYGEPIIKRVIAVEGDTVKIDYTKGEVYRNGELLSEDYIKDLTHFYMFGYMESGKEYTVPKNCVFVMGDNRNVSNDSRNLSDVGFIDRNKIMGKAFVRVIPFKDFKWL